MLQVSPIKYVLIGNILLIPCVSDHLPQQIDQDSFVLALHMAAEANNPYFRVDYNSLGAFAKTNH
jgi:GDP-L-galactose phosphorylase